MERTYVALVLPEFFFLMIRRPPRSTLDPSSAASDVYKRQGPDQGPLAGLGQQRQAAADGFDAVAHANQAVG